MEQLPCPDGFLLDSTDRLRDAHEQISLWLVEMEQGAPPDFRTLKKRFRPPQLADLLESACIRLDAARRLHSDRLQSMLLALSRTPQTLADDRLAALLNFCIVRAHGWWPPEDVCDLLEAEWRRRDLGEQVWRLMRRLHEATEGNNTITDQTARRRLALLLWHDPHDEIDPKRCWSEILRRDLRAMGESQRRQWTAALGDIVVSDNTEPPKPFLKASAGHIAAIGEVEFRRKLIEWLGPFRGPDPVRLTMAGSHILKGLLWYARPLRDDSIDIAVLALLNTKWRNKDFVFRPLTVLAGSVAQFPAEEAWPILLRLQELLGSKAGARFTKQLEEVGARLGKSEGDLRAEGLLPAPPQKRVDYIARMMRMLEKMQVGPSPSRFIHDGDYIEVQGRRDLYRAHTPTFTIRRVRDNALVELDYTRVPSYWSIDPEDSGFQLFTKLLFALGMNDSADFLMFN